MSSIIQIVIGGLLQGGVFAIAALGFSLVFRVTNIVNLAQGAFCVLGAMGMYFFQVVFGWPLLLSALAATLCSVVFCTFVGLVSFVPAASRLPNSGALVLTAGLLTFFVGITLLVWGNQPYSLPPFSGEAPIVLGDIRIPTQGLWLGAVSAVMIAALWFLVQKTTLGRALRACAENPAAARLMGIDLHRMILLSFALASLIGAVGGILIAPLMSLQFDSGHFFTIFGFVAVAIGGMGSFAGAIVGGLFLGVSEQFAAYYVSSLFANTLALLMLLGLLVFRPSGLFPSGPTRRSDVRDEARVNRGLVQTSSRRAVFLALATLAALALLPAMPLSPGLLGSLVITLILYIAVLGLDVLMGFAGQVSLGHAAFMAVGGYCAAILTTTYGWPPLLAVAAAIMLSVLCALALAFVTARLRGHYLALATLAFGLLIDSLTVGLVDLTGGPSGLVGIPSFSIGAFSFGSQLSMYYLVLAVCAALVLALEGGMRMGFGRALKSVRSDQLAASALGINVGRVKIAALCISAALAALSGALYAFSFHFLSPDMVETPKSFELIAMLVLGGEGTLVGGLFGALVLTMLPTLMQDLAAFKTAIEGAILVIMILFMPEGIYGRAVAWLNDGVHFDRLRVRLGE